MNKLPSIGIIGGAGPEAGALLFQQIIQVCQQDFSCQRDYEFPLIHLLSYPFSEMLEKGYDPNLILSELKEAFNQLNTDFIVIACNTLHTFLDQSFRPPRFIHLIKVTAHNLTGKPLVLCSTTSKERRIHEQFFPCEYPTISLQAEIDNIINDVLKRGVELLCKNRLEELIQQAGSHEVLLGCTELSLIHHSHPIRIKNISIIDPSWNLAKTLCSLIFNGNGSREV